MMKKVTSEKPITIIAPTSADLADILCRHGIIQRAAIEDPEGYDGRATMDAVACAAEEISISMETAIKFAAYLNETVISPHPPYAMERLVPWYPAQPPAHTA